MKNQKIKKMILAELIGLILIVDQTEARDYFQNNNCTPNDLNLMKRCLDICLTDSTECITNCGTDSACISQCSRNHVHCDEACPCTKGLCYDGCDGCENKICQGQTILVLCSSSTWRDPYILNSNGEHSKVAVTYGANTDGHGSCSVNYKNKFLLLGGYYQPTQVSELDGCHLKRINNLNFDFKMGSCGVFHIKTKDVILLCFSDQNNGINERRKCWTYDGVDNDSVKGNSNYGHSLAGVSLGNYRNQPFVAGGKQSAAPNSQTKQAEILSLDSLTWKIQVAYP
jgi:hypothetical protein